MPHEARTPSKCNLRPLSVSSPFLNPRSLPAAQSRPTSSAHNLIQPPPASVPNLHKSLPAPHRLREISGNLARSTGKGCPIKVRRRRSGQIHRDGAFGPLSPGSYRPPSPKGSNQHSLARPCRPFVDSQTGKNVIKGDLINQDFLKSAPGLCRLQTIAYIPILCTLVSTVSCHHHGIVQRAGVLADCDCV
ncbi:hypothetical protein K437DRAFT_46667 [Tilletiaria anomala UBC 951]|uniref:Uncharacterized protein n=1 Tax=Tilletiaria anomala (strain ATCC 24038 / CBS 436.72 / UBC 951) TaxID=1037660 RepID=A0A066WDL5_TILAU|nr:uncharacterized protein K437DRAFT_46667 [Tilletiaria anomala UBC 951]KDN52037.1 hypothetical protein K437DRAFT_46667 [Tilletiaria anomala UBC 951]